MTPNQFDVATLGSIVSFPILGFLVHWIRGRRHQFSRMRVMHLGFSGATFPTFVILLPGLIFPELHQLLAGKEVFLALAGFAGVVVTLDTLIPD